MAKKYYTFKKYEESRKRTEKFLKKIDRSNRKALNRMLKPKKKKRSASRTTTHKANYKASSTQKQATGPLTVGDIMLALCSLLLFGLFFIFWIEMGFWKAVWTTIILFLLVSQIRDDLSNKTFDIFGYIFIALVAITVILCFSMGFWKGLLISVGICVLALVLYVIFGDNEEAEGAEAESEEIPHEEQQEDRSEQIPYLQSLLAEFDKHKEIINTSDNPDAVKRSLDCLLGIMDEIMTFDEMLLRKAGMTKSQMPEHKARVLELYDTMIEQAREEQKNKQS